MMQFVPLIDLPIEELFSLIIGNYSIIIIESINRSGLISQLDRAIKILIF
jgi:hypothetical protein